MGVGGEVGGHGAKNGANDEAGAQRRFHHEVTKDTKTEMRREGSGEAAKARSGEEGEEFEVGALNWILFVHFVASWFKAFHRSISVVSVGGV